MEAAGRQAGCDRWGVGVKSRGARAIPRVCQGLCSGLTPEGAAF